MKKSTKVYAVVGPYDANGNYEVAISKYYLLKDIPNSISKHIYLDRDLSIHVAPSIEVRAFARSKEVFDELFAIVKDQDYFKNMLDCFSEYHGPSKDYIWTTVDLEEERQIQKEKYNPYF